MNSLLSKYFSIIFLLIMFTSCTEKKEEKLIPENQFISILTDSYLADGLLTIPKIRDMFSKRDTTEIYIEIVKSHGYSWEEMQNTLNEYFTGDPKRFSKIYDQILLKLSEMESIASFAQQQKLAAEADKLRTKFNFILPDSSVREKPGFEYNINCPGTYRLMFSVRLYPTDESLDPCFTARIVPANAQKGDKIIFLPAIRYIKDGRQHEYTLSGEIKSEGPAVFKGYYLDSRNNPAWGSHYAEIHNLAFNFIGLVK